MPERITVKLSQLVPGPNARADIKKINIDDLVASIGKRGLINPLIVTANGDGKKYEVRAGGRRLRALAKLYKSQAKTFDVPVIVIPDDEAAESIALADNVVRVNLHPVDEYRQYSDLVAKGLAPAEIAAEFGTSERWVRQRLQLAKLAPPLLEEWRKGKMDAEQAKALSASPDHAQQIKVWTHGAKDQWLSTPRTLRQDVLRAVRKQDWPEFKLIGAEAYEAAGGTYSDDLFSDDRLVLNGDLVEQMVEAVLQQDCARLREDGWLWVHTENSGNFHEYELVDHDLTAWATGDEAGELSIASYVERRRILEAIQARALNDPNARAVAGVLVDVEADGSVRRRYFVNRTPEYHDHESDRNEDEMDAAGIPAEDREESSALGEREREPEARSVSASVEPQSEPPKINFALRERLTEILTVALSRALARNPKVAIAALIASLKVTIDSPHSSPPLRIKTSAWEIIGPRDDEADHRWERNFEAALATPEFAEPMLALLISKTIDLRWPKLDYDRGWSERMRKEITASFRRALDLSQDIAELFDPAEYFSRLTIAQISDVLRHSLNYSEGVLPSGKAALVMLAVEKAREAKWLPEELREP
jgi:ParB family transcriptional regulator, chromosome partitioning protein